MILQETQRQTFLAFCLSDAIMLPVRDWRRFQSIGARRAVVSSAKESPNSKKNIPKNSSRSLSSLATTGLLDFLDITNKWWLWTPTAQVLSSPKGSVRLKKDYGRTLLKRDMLCFHSVPLNFLDEAPPCPRATRLQPSYLILRTPSHRRHCKIGFGTDA